MKFGPRELVWTGPLTSTKTTHDTSPTTDGLLSVTVFGADDRDWSYATVTLAEPTSLNPHPIPWPILTWAYSAEQDFAKSATVTIPMAQGQPYKLDWGSDRRGYTQLGITVSWMPVAA